MGKIAINTIFAKPCEKSYLMKVSCSSHNLILILITIYNSQNYYNNPSIFIHGGGLFSCSLAGERGESINWEDSAWSKFREDPSSVCPCCLNLIHTVDRKFHTAETEHRCAGLHMSGTHMLHFLNLNTISFFVPPAQRETTDEGGPQNEYIH